MSLKTLPLLFINLGGEMLYILDQRLKAQAIPDDKAKKVMHDIIGTMLNKRFMEELFKPQEMYSKKAMRTVFDRLAHASIMRLNPASMDKLYDLMTMAFKYQVSLSLRAKDVLLVTLNHMDAIRVFAEGNSALSEQVENVFKLLLHTYASIPPGEFMLIRQTLLSFFQDNHIKVSIFLKDKVQGNNGRFILPENPHVPFQGEVPGQIKYFDDKEKQKNTAKFNSGGKFQKAQKEGSFKAKGDRVTKLGSNMYSTARPADIPTSSPAPASLKPTTSKNLAAKVSTTTTTPEPSVSTLADPKAKEQLDLLSKLLSGPANEKKQSASNTDFRLNLFNTDEEEEAAALLRTPNKVESQIVNIDASKRGENRVLSKIAGEMSVDEGDEAAADNADLLDLMDVARK